MKRFPLLLVVALVLVAGCDDSDTAPSDDNRPQFIASLLPANEVPPIQGAEAAANGSAVIHLNLTRDAAGAITAATADFQVQLSGFPAGAVVSAAHIHPGAAGTNGPVLVNTGISAGQVALTNGVGSFTSNGITVTAANAQAIVNNPSLFYFNVHTQANTGGVARGQMIRN